MKTSIPKLIEGPLCPTRPYIYYNYILIAGIIIRLFKAVTKYHDNLKLKDPKQPKEKTTISTTAEIPRRKRSPIEILHLARNLPLLPAEKLDEGLKYISFKIDEQIKEWPDLGIFRDYLYQQWAGKAEIFTCFGKVIRTNNPSEAFNRTLLKRMGGKNPHLLVFLCK